MQISGWILSCPYIMHMIFVLSYILCVPIYTLYIATHMNLSDILNPGFFLILLIKFLLIQYNTSLKAFHKVCGKFFSHLF